MVLGHQGSVWHVCNTLQDAKKWSKVRHYLKTDLLAKHKPFYKVLALAFQEPSGSAEVSPVTAMVTPDRMSELAQLAEDSLLDAGSGKALNDCLVKNTSKRLCYVTH